jgi:hypothetical protein
MMRMANFMYDLERSDLCAPQSPNSRNVLMFSDTNSLECIRDFCSVLFFCLFPNKDTQEREGRRDKKKSKKLLN